MVNTDDNYIRLLDRFVKLTNRHLEKIDMNRPALKNGTHIPVGPPGTISLREASRRFGIAVSTLSRWVRKGYIPKILETPGALFIDENTLIEIATSYKKEAGQGKHTILKITSLL